MAVNKASNLAEGTVNKLQKVLWLTKVVPQNQEISICKSVTDECIFKQKLVTSTFCFRFYVWLDRSSL